MVNALRTLGVLAVAAGLCAPRAAGADDVLRIVQFDTHSSIQIAHFGVGSRWTGTSTQTTSTENATFSCVSFGNVDPRVATSVRFHFAEYDTLGALVHEDNLDRSGAFAQNVIIDSINQKSHSFNQEDCVLNPERLRRGGLIVVFVKAVKYRDGSVWNTNGPAVPEHLGIDAPGASPSPASTPS